jgi:hypothetical protein
MRWRTFERPTVEHGAFAEQSLAGIAQGLGFKL